MHNVQVGMVSLQFITATNETGHRWKATSVQFSEYLTNVKFFPLSKRHGPIKAGTHDLADGTTGPYPVG